MPNRGKRDSAVRAAGPADPRPRLGQPRERRTPRAEKGHPWDGVTKALRERLDGPSPWNFGTTPGESPAYKDFDEILSRCRASLARILRGTLDGRDRPRGAARRACRPVSTTDPMSAMVSELAGDASTRRYYRSGTPRRSPPLRRRHAVPGRGVAGGGASFLTSTVPDGRRSPRPGRVRSDPKANLLFLEDAGDTMLEDAVRDLGARLPAALRAVRRDPGPDPVRGHRALDGKASHRASPSTSRNSAGRSTSSSGTPYGNTEGSGCPTGKRGDRDLFLRSSSSCPASAMLAHRDYHSRNVMVLAPRRPPATGTCGSSTSRTPGWERLLRSGLAAARLLRHLAGGRVEDLRYAWRHVATAELRCAAGDPAPSPGGSIWPRFSAREGDRDVRHLAHNRGADLPSFIPPTVANLRETSNGTRRCAPRGRLLPILSALAEKRRRRAA